MILIVEYIIILLLLVVLSSTSFISFLRPKSHISVPSSLASSVSSSVPSSSASSSLSSSQSSLSSSQSSLDLTAYNGSNIDIYYNKRPLEVWERLVEIGSPILGWWLLRKWDNITSPFTSKTEKEQNEINRAIDLKDAIVQGKSVTFIKSGQALALRPDIVKSAAYVSQLQKLQDEVGVFDNNIAMNIIKDELGKDATDIYEFTPLEPIASASIGQVYKARLRANNASVAVKVQRPDAIKMAALDMYILRKLAQYIKKQKKLRSNLVGIVDEFGAQLYNELNYRQEASNCQRFKDLYGDIPGVYVPAVYKDLTSQRVLTMEFVEGEKGPWVKGGEKMLTIGLQCSVLQLLGGGYFHQDPHNGNLLMTPQGDLAYLDFGMMSEVPAKQRYALIGTVLGLVNKDIKMVVENLNILEFFEDNTNTNLVISTLNKALNDATDGGLGSASTLNFTRLNQNLESASASLPFRAPPFYTLIVRTLTILEGLALYVDPNFRLIRGAYPFVAKQILSNPNTELIELLSSIIISPDKKIRWDKLEQFLSIASSADDALAGNFEALKGAQEKSDLIRTYSGETQQSNFTLDVTVRVIDFLLSDKGTFLREPLLDEVVDIIDNVGLTTMSLSSLLTNGLLPKPSEKPNQERVERFFNFLKVIINNNSNTTSNVFDNSRIVVSKIFDIITKAIYYTSNTNNSPNLDKYMKFLTQIMSRLTERNVRRAVKTIASPANIQNTLLSPVVTRIIDFLPFPSNK